MYNPQKKFNGKRYGTVTQKDQKPSPRTLLDGWPRGPILGPVKHIGGLESSPLVNNVKHWDQTCTFFNILKRKASVPGCLSHELFNEVPALN